MKATGIYTQKMWDNAADLIHQLQNHPFTHKLADGTLAFNVFEHYLKQDILYIKDDAKALEILSHRAINNDEKIFFKHLANDGIEVEHVLQNDYLKHFNIYKTDLKSDICEQYTHFLLSQAQYAPYPVAIAALLPCYWVYNFIGNQISKNQKTNNFYNKWILTYSGVEYSNLTHKFIEIAESHASKGR